MIHKRIQYSRAIAEFQSGYGCRNIMLKGWQKTITEMSNVRAEFQINDTWCKLTFDDDHWIKFSSQEQPFFPKEVRIDIMETRRFSFHFGLWSHFDLHAETLSQISGTYPQERTLRNVPTEQILLFLIDHLPMNYVFELETSVLLRVRV